MPPISMPPNPMMPISILPNLNPYNPMSPNTMLTNPIQVQYTPKNTMPLIMISANPIQCFTAMDNPKFNAADFDAPKYKLKTKTVFVR